MLLTPLVLLYLGSAHALNQLDVNDLLPGDDTSTLWADRYAIFGTTTAFKFGVQAYNLGDINGDGLDDLIFGETGYGSYGRFVVVFGNDTATRTSVTTDTAAAAPNGFVITSEIAGPKMGHTVASGDYNNDDKLDIVIGIYSSGTAGYAVVLWGHTSWADIVISTSMDPSVGVVLSTGVSNDQFAHGVAHLGDFNDDSYNDFAVTAPYADEHEENAGAVYVVFGGPSLASGTLNTSNSLVVVGASASASLGVSVAGGDFNKDSIPDLVVTAATTPGSPTLYLGRVYVILGRATRAIGEMLLSEFVSGTSTGMYIDAVVSYRGLGRNVDAGTDVNGDGYGDVLIGSTTGSRDTPGIAVVLYGRGVLFESLTVDTMAPGDGFVVSGFDATASDYFGQEVGFLGHVDDDLYGDYYVTYYPSDEYATAVFYGQEDSAEPDYHVMVNTYHAFDTGNHLGYGTHSLGLTSKLADESSGAGFIFENFTSLYITASPTSSPSTLSPTATPTTLPPSSSPTASPSTAPTASLCDIIVSTSGGAGLSWDLTDAQGDEEIASGEFGGEAVEFDLIASEEYLLFLSSATVPAGTSITVSVNGQETLLPLEGVASTTEIAGVTCEAITNKLAATDSAYSTGTTALLLALAVVVLQ